MVKNTLRLAHLMGLRAYILWRQHKLEAADSLGRCVMEAYKKIGVESDTQAF
jgi:hypothetical protein